MDISGILGNQNYKLVESSMDPRQQAIEAQIEAAGVVNPVRTFAFDDTEVADYATNIKNILKEFIRICSLA